ncbi:unnamed protein product [Pleuronectes platessa]|uniref:Uncharacterized protein n=1 Tax=Pleuronectes platessa TaxID=8262 RepID=A0A9N7Y6N2_PLEPL|nr:unnamed protein product [Pleuronectes platessa]
MSTPHIILETQGQIQVTGAWGALAPALAPEVPLSYGSSVQHTAPSSTEDSVSLISISSSSTVQSGVFPVAIRSRQAEKIDSTPKRSLHGARQPRHNATLQPPVCSALRFNMGVDGSQRIGAALTPRFGVATASGVNPA